MPEVSKNWIDSARRTAVRAVCSTVEYTLRTRPLGKEPVDLFDGIYLLDLKRMFMPDGTLESLAKVLEDIVNLDGFLGFEVQLRVHKGPRGILPYPDELQGCKITLTRKASDDHA